MFMIDMHGTLDLATASSSSRTPGERYCGSCMASATRSKSAGFDRGRAGGGELAWELLRVELDQVLAAPDRQPHPDAVLVDRIGFGGQADQLDAVAAEQELGSQQRSVGRAQKQDVVSARHDVLPRVDWLGGGNPAARDPCGVDAICLAARLHSKIASGTHGHHPPPGRPSAARAACATMTSCSILAPPAATAPMTSPPTVIGKPPFTLVKSPMRTAMLSASASGA